MAALKSLVIIMGILIVFLFGLLVYGIYQKLQNPDFSFFSDSGTVQSQTSTPTNGSGAPASAMGSSEDAARFGEISLDLPQGAKVVSANALGGKLVIVIARDGVNADLVAVIDLNTGQILGQVKTQP